MTLMTAFPVNTVRARVTPISRPSVISVMHGGKRGRVTSPIENYPGGKLLLALPLRASVSALDLLKDRPSARRMVRFGANGGELPIDQRIA